MNGEISIQNGENCPILNGEICGVCFSIKNQNASEKNEWRNLHSERIFLHSERRKFPVDVFFSKKNQKRF
jgi:hypothetical protein